ncbi:hypothetical protein P9112_006497 [Eukaryota sp. TZLM1-RC]
MEDLNIPNTPAFKEPEWFSSELQHTSREELEELASSLALGIDDKETGIRSLVKRHFDSLVTYKQAVDLLSTLFDDSFRYRLNNLCYKLGEQKTIAQETYEPLFKKYRALVVAKNLRQFHERRYGLSKLQESLRQSIEIMDFESICSSFKQLKSVSSFNAQVIDQKLSNSLEEIRILLYKKIIYLNVEKTNCFQVISHLSELGIPDSEEIKTGEEELIKGSEIPVPRTNAKFWLFSLLAKAVVAQITEKDSQFQSEFNQNLNQSLNQSVSQVPYHHRVHFSDNMDFLYDGYGSDEVFDDNDDDEIFLTYVSSLINSRLHCCEILFELQSHLGEFSSKIRPYLSNLYSNSFLFIMNSLSEHLRSLLLIKADSPVKVSRQKHLELTPLSVSTCQFQQSDDVIRPPSTKVLIELVVLLKDFSIFYTNVKVFSSLLNDCFSELFRRLKVDFSRDLFTKFSTSLTHSSDNSLSISEDAASDDNRYDFLFKFLEKRLSLLSELTDGWSVSVNELRFVVSGMLKNIPQVLSNTENSDVLSPVVSSPSFRPLDVDSEVARRLALLFKDCSLLGQCEGKFLDLLLNYPKFIDERYAKMEVSLLLSSLVKSKNFVLNSLVEFYSFNLFMLIDQGLGCEDSHTSPEVFSFGQFTGIRNYVVELLVYFLSINSFLFGYSFNSIDVLFCRLIFAVANKLLTCCTYLRNLEDELDQISESSELSEVTQTSELSLVQEICEIMFFKKVFTGFVECLSSETASLFDACVDVLTRGHDQTVVKETLIDCSDIIEAELANYSFLLF